MVLWCALAWSQVLNVDVAEPWTVGDGATLTTTAAVDSNPQWFAGNAETAVVLGLQPAMAVAADPS